MATKVRNTGFEGDTTNLPMKMLPGQARRAVLQTSTGTALVVIVDPNSSASDATYGDGTGTAKLYIYESNTARTSWTLRLTTSLFAWPAGPLVFSAEIFSNNDIGVVYLGTDGRVKYRKITYSTWTAGAQEDAYIPASGITVWSFDIAITAPRPPRRPSPPCPPAGSQA